MRRRVSVSVTLATPACSARTVRRAISQMEPERYACHVDVILQEHSIHFVTALVFAHAKRGFTVPSVMSASLAISDSVTLDVNHVNATTTQVPVCRSQAPV